MDVKSLLNRYERHTLASAYSPKTVSHVRHPVSAFASFLAGVPAVSFVTDEDSQDYIIELTTRPRWEIQPQEKVERTLSQTSSNTYVRGIKALWAWLLANKVFSENRLEPVRTPKLPQRLPKALSPHDVEAVCRCCNSSRDQVIVLLLIDTHMRLSKLAGPRIDSFDESESRIRVIGKGNKERPVCLSGWTNAVLTTHLGFERPGELFCRDRSSRLRMAMRALRRASRRYWNAWEWKQVCGTGLDHASYATRTQPRASSTVPTLSISGAR